MISVVEFYCSIQWVKDAKTSRFVYYAWLTYSSMHMDIHISMFNYLFLSMNLLQELFWYFWHRLPLEFYSYTVIASIHNLTLKHQRIYFNPWIYLSIHWNILMHTWHSLHHILQTIYNHFWVIEQWTLQHPETYLVGYHLNNVSTLEFDNHHQPLIFMWNVTCTASSGQRYNLWAEEIPHGSKPFTSWHSFRQTPQRPLDSIKIIFKPKDVW